MAKYCFPERDKAALLTISVQRDFLETGSPVRAFGAAAAMPAIRRLITGFRARQAPIYHGVRLYRPDGSNVDACRREAIEEGSRFLMPGSLGSELPDDCKPDPTLRLDPERLLSGQFQELGPREWALYRPRWGAFFGTGLEDHLRGLGVSTVVICGLSFATGIRASVYEATARDFRTVVVPDALACVNEGSVCELARMGVYLMDSRSCLSWLSGSGRHPSGGDTSCAA